MRTCEPSEQCAEGVWAVTDRTEWTRCRGGGGSARDAWVAEWCWLKCEATE